MSVPFFKKGKSRPTTARRRSPSPSAPTQQQVVIPSKKQQHSLLTAGSKRTFFQRDDPDANTNRDDDDDNDDNRNGPDVKWTASGSHVSTALEIIAGDEAVELLAKRARKDNDSAGEDEGPDDGLYRGQAAYRTHLKKNKDVPKAMRVGPQRSTDTIKTITIVDYQPDVCKDYKGALCVSVISDVDERRCRDWLLRFWRYVQIPARPWYMYVFLPLLLPLTHHHYCLADLAGWQLDAVASAPKSNAKNAPSSGSDSDEDIPFACLICRKPYTDPIVTRCGHYFCSACAIRRFARTPKCRACGAPTGGMFNRAGKVIEKVARKKREMGDDGEADGDGGGGESEVKEGEVVIEGLKEGV
jgi:RING finger protein 113A